MITHIIWDYNGTILDDVNTSVLAVNEMLKKRGLPPTTKEIYQQTLCLPLDIYYTNIGIVNPDISTLSIEFNDLCKKFSHTSKIFDSFYSVIKKVRQINIKNILMSSLYEKYLFDDIKKYNIEIYFDDIIGMKDTKVGDKTSNAKQYIKQNNLSSENLLFIGDLTSDSDMAKCLGANCILIPNGHNSKNRCLSQGFPVVDDLNEIIDYLQTK